MKKQTRPNKGAVKPLIDNNNNNNNNTNNVIHFDG
jgi:hypothetical protein